MKMDHKLAISNNYIGLTHKPFIIAEMSGNHNQSLDRALAIVDAAADAGAHAIKVQTYTADTMTLDIREGEFLISDPNSLWAGKSLHQLYEEAHTPWDWHKPIFERCRERGLICFSTPFDETSVDFLETLECPCYKIASFENVDIPLIKRVAATGKPLIMSTGLANIAELSEAVTAARDNGCNNLILLKCTSTYPADPENSNILTIPHMRDLFGCQVGLSDHTLGIGVAVAAVALGATVIEKHFTLRRSDGGVDSAFSLEPEEMKSLVLEANRAWQSLGKVFYGPKEDEKKSLAYRRSLYIVKNLQKGDIFTTDNLRSIRPGCGLPTKHINTFLGKLVNKDVKKGTPLSWDLIG
jgi:N-acetylneuraminate synthase